MWRSTWEVESICDTKQPNSARAQHYQVQILPGIKQFAKMQATPDAQEPRKELQDQKGPPKELQDLKPGITVETSSSNPKFSPLRMVVTEALNIQRPDLPTFSFGCGEDQNFGLSTAGETGESSPEADTSNVDESADKDNLQKEDVNFSLKNSSRRAAPNPMAAAPAATSYVAAVSTCPDLPAYQFTGVSGDLPSIAPVRRPA